MLALLVKIAVAIWLSLTVFLMPHTAASAGHALVLSTAIAALALFTYVTPGAPNLRWGNLALGLWLLFAVFVFPPTSGWTLFHEVAVALVLTLLALVPPLHRHEAPPATKPA